MFGFLGFLWIAAGSIPFILTITKVKKLGKKVLAKKIRNAIIIFLVDIALLVVINLLFYYLTEIRWFMQFGFEQRFITFITSKISLFWIGFVIAFIFLYVNICYSLKKLSVHMFKSVYIGVIFVFSVFHGLSAGGLWYKTLLFLNQASSSLLDPLWGKPVGFYLFTLPFLEGMLNWLWWLIISAFLVCLAPLLINRGMLHKDYMRSEEFKQRVMHLKLQALLLMAFVFFVFAAFSYINIYKMMLSESGVVRGVDFVDNNYRVLGFTVTIIIYVLTGAILLLSVFIPKMRRMLVKKKYSQARGKDIFTMRTYVLPLSVVVVLIVFNFLVPAVLSSLLVKPNEITLEKPYIQNSIEFTRRAYNIHSGSIEEKMYDVDKVITEDITAMNQSTLANVRLWDWRALMDNLKEQQEIRLYYSFHDVDIDRYTIDGDYKQVMLSVREMDKTNLDVNSRTWVSTKLKYTHGYGLVMLPVHEILMHGKPKLIIKNIPPQSDFSLTLKRPEVYYGEKTNDYVYVNTEEEEFDYPRGDDNVYARYRGKGGVRINSLLTRLAYAWMFDDYRLLFSGYFTQESRVMLRRNILERVSTIAPFLVLDGDPYAVLTDDGRIIYILDAYFISGDFPYSEKYHGAISFFHGVNYIRNSVKVTVDAYNGEVKFYVMDENDVLMATHRNIFPELFTPFEEMPEGIKKHIRYPEALFTLQAEMYSTYHMEDPEIFYQREDVWTFATERYRQDFQYVVPYYVMIQFPGQSEAEFVLMVPFTPKNKNVINAWMAGKCDHPNYGKLVVYKFPKGVEVLGPRQIEARIDQNTEMSQAMTLWGQRGSEVIRGNLLAIPLFSRDSVSIFYAEPIFLQAEDAKLPELKRIALADQESVVWSENFDDALNKLLGGAKQEIVAAEAKIAGIVPDKTSTADRGLSEIIEQINSAFQSYKSLAGQGRFEEAGEYLDKIDNLIQTGQKMIE